MISICIPTYKRPENLNNLLANLLGFVNNEDQISEILIAITGSYEYSINDVTAHLLRSFEIQGISVHIVTHFSGLLKAKKWFNEFSRSEILLLLDDDVLITRDYLKLAKHFEEKSVGAVSGSLQTPLDINYYKDYSYEPIPAPSQDILCNRLVVNDLGQVQIKDKYQVYMLDKSKIYRCQCLIGTALFVRHSIFDVDLAFERGNCNLEEVDFTYNMFLKGYDLLFDSSQVAYHIHSSSGGMREFVDKRKEENSKYFLEKYGDEIR